MLLHRHFEQNSEETRKNMTTSHDVTPSRKFIEEGADITMNVAPPTNDYSNNEEVNSSIPIEAMAQKRGRPRRGN